jgi:hypothetical protein
MTEKAYGKVSPGIFLRDVSEIRAGFDAFNFHNCRAAAPTDEDHCLSIVGTECTLAIEFPTKVRPINIIYFLYAVCIIF